MTLDKSDHLQIFKYSFCTLLVMIPHCVYLHIMMTQNTVPEYTVLAVFLIKVYCSTVKYLPSSLVNK